jgi:hypothetical protein
MVEYPPGGHKFAQKFDKLLSASFDADHEQGFVWIETWEQDHEEEVYPIWLLVETNTDRMLASIEGPTANNICYTVALENSQGIRKYISLDGAKRHAISEAMKILDQEKEKEAQERKTRRTVKKGSYVRNAI